MRDRPLEHHFPDAIAEVKGFAIFMLDTNGIIQTWNKGCELMKGFTESEAIGQNFDILFPDFLREQHLPENDACLGLIRQCGDAQRADGRQR